MYCITRNKFSSLDSSSPQTRARGASPTPQVRSPPGLEAQRLHQGAQHLHRRPSPPGKGFLSSSLLGKADLHACEQTSLHAGQAVLDHEAVAGGGGGRLEPAVGWVEIGWLPFLMIFILIVNCIVCELDHSHTILSEQQGAAMNYIETGHFEWEFWYNLLAATVKISGWGLPWHTSGSSLPYTFKRTQCFRANQMQLDLCSTKRMGNQTSIKNLKGSNNLSKDIYI